MIVDGQPARPIRDGSFVAPLELLSRRRRSPYRAGRRVPRRHELDAPSATAPLTAAEFAAGRKAATHGVQPARRSSARCTAPRPRPHCGVHPRRRQIAECRVLRSTGGGSDRRQGQRRPTRRGDRAAPRRHAGQVRRRRTLDPVQPAIVDPAADPRTGTCEPCAEPTADHDSFCQCTYRQLARAAARCGHASPVTRSCGRSGPTTDAQPRQAAELRAPGDSRLRAVPARQQRRRETGHPQASLATRIRQSRPRRRSRLRSRPPAAHVSRRASRTRSRAPDRRRRPTSARARQRSFGPVGQPHRGPPEPRLPHSVATSGRSRLRRVAEAGRDVLSRVGDDDRARRGPRPGCGAAAPATTTSPPPRTRSARPGLDPVAAGQRDLALARAVIEHRRDPQRRAVAVGVGDRPAARIGRVDQAQRADDRQAGARAPCAAAART